MVNTQIEYENIIIIIIVASARPRRGQTLEAEAEARTLEAEAEARTLEAEARPRGLTSLVYRTPPPYVGKHPWQKAPLGGVTRG